MAKFMDDAGKEAFGQAVRAIENRSSAEVVVAVRHHSGSYVHADLLAGILVGGWAGGTLADIIEGAQGRQG